MDGGYNDEGVRVRVVLYLVNLRFWSYHSSCYQVRIFAGVW